jgi:hypothetical protein
MRKCTACGGLLGGQTTTPHEPTMVHLQYCNTNEKTKNHQKHSHTRNPAAVGGPRTRAICARRFALLFAAPRARADSPRMSLRSPCFRDAIGSTFSQPYGDDGGPMAVVFEKRVRAPRQTSQHSIRCAAHSSVIPPVSQRRQTSVHPFRRLPVCVLLHARSKIFTSRLQLPARCRTCCATRPSSRRHSLQLPWAERRSRSAATSSACSWISWTTGSRRTKSGTRQTLSRATRTWRSPPRTCALGRSANKPAQQPCIPCKTLGCRGCPRR